VTAPQDLMVAVQLDRVQYEPLPPVTLTLTWTVLTPSGRCYSQVYQDPGLTSPVGGAVAQSADGRGTWTQADAGIPPLAPDREYWIAITNDPVGRRPISGGLPTLRTAPLLKSLNYQPGYLDICWEPPRFPPFNDYEVTLGTASGGWLLTKWMHSIGYPVVNSGDRALRLDMSDTPLTLIAGRLPFGLRPIYSAGTGVSVGPEVNTQTYLAPPVVKSAAFAGGGPADGLSYRVELLTPRDLTSNPKFQVAVAADGHPYGDPYFADSQTAGNVHTITIRVPPAPQQGGTRVWAGVAFTALIAMADQLKMSTGPAAARLPLFTTGPAVTAATYADRRLAVTIAQADDAAALVAVASVDGRAEVARAIVAGPTGSLQFETAPGEAYRVTAASLAGSVLGPPGPAVPMLTAAPVLVSASYDDGVLRVTWQPPAGGSSRITVPDRYRISALAGETVIAESTAGGTAGVLRAELPPSQVAVQVAGLLAAAEGPATPAVPLLTGRPAVTSAVADPVSGAIVISWSPVPAATGYRVQLYRDGLPSGAPADTGETRWTLEQSPAAGADMAVSVTAVRSVTADGQTVTVTGPASAAHRLPATRTTITAVAYDGANAAVSWQPSVAASGYTVTVLHGSTVISQATAPATSSSATAGVELTDSAGDYEVVVQVLSGSDAGPPAEPYPLLTPALFISADLPETSYPHVYPAVNPAVARRDIVAYLPQLGGSGPLTQPEIDKDPFRLEETHDAAFPYRLTIPADSKAWQFGPEPLRAEVQTAYAELLIAVEDAGGSAPGVTLLQDVIARLLPQTFQETLYYGWGLDLVKGTVDLRPGTILRVSSADYLYTGQAPNQPLLFGYLGGARSDIDVGSYRDGQGRWRVGYDLFAAQLVSSGVLEVTPPKTEPGKSAAGVADGADLLFDGLRQPFHRLFVPPKLLSPTGIGSTMTTENFALAAAASFKQLRTVANYPERNPVGYFRGRAIVTPCAQVMVNGVIETVPVGTTVGNVLDQAAARPGGAAAPLSGLRLCRSVGSAAVDGSSPPGRFVAGVVREVRFEWQKLPVYGPGFDALSLPLLPGDRLAFGS
jgi:hypothetical protein